MFNKNGSALVIGLVIGAVVLGVGGFIAYNQNQNKNTSVAQNNTEDEVEDNFDEGYEEVTGSVADLLKLGKNFTCKIDYSDDLGNSTKGAVYVAASGNKMAGEFTTNMSDGTTATSNIITDGEYSYVWSSDFDQGFKTKLNKDDLESSFDFSSNSDNTALENPAFDSNMSFMCKRWSVENSMFNPPSSVEFLDPSASFNRLINEIDLPQEVDCSACDSVPEGAAKDACMQALGC
jgi:hypothetical protein